MKIFRGEAIKHGRPERLDTFRKTLRSGFPAEFINGGNPYFLAQRGFFDTSTLHVANDFQIGDKRHLKHFISFSEDRNTALRYAHGSSATPEYIDEVESRLHYEDVTSSLLAGTYSFDVFDGSDHMIASLDLTGGTPLDRSYDLGIIKTYNGGRSKILALKAYAYFALQVQRMGKHVTNDVLQAAGYSKHDLEWLVLVLDLIQPQADAPASSSALVAHGDPLTIELCVDITDGTSSNSARFI